VSAIVAFWSLLGVDWEWDFERSNVPFTIPAGREKVIIVTRDREGVFYPSAATFNSPYCGIRFKTDRYDSEFTFSAYNLNLTGAVFPNNALYCPRYDTKNNIYTVVTGGLWPFREELVFSLFNSGPNDAACLSYFMWYCYAPKNRIAEARRRFIKELIRGLR